MLRLLFGWQYASTSNWQVSLFLDYHQLNSQKKYDQGLRFALVKIPGPFS